MASGDCSKNIRYRAWTTSGERSADSNAFVVFDLTFFEPGFDDRAALRVRPEFPL
jgi:hypothetical protein